MGGLKNFFAHTNHAFPVALSEHGKLRKCNKADFLNCLPLPENAMEPPKVDVFVIDGPGFVHVNFPEKSMQTFHAYCKEQLDRKIDCLLGHAERIDLAIGHQRGKKQW